MKKLDILAIAVAGIITFGLIQTASAAAMTTVTGEVVGATGMASSSSSANAHSNTSASSQSNRSDAVNVGITVAADGTFSANQSDINAAEVNAATHIALRDAASVSSDSDLGLYVAGIMSSDKNVSNVQVDSDNVTVSYPEPAELFGFIPILITTKAEVDSNGNATLHYPWYKFFTAVDDTNLRANLAAQAQAGVMSSSLASAKARAISALYAALKANANVRTSASANAQSNTSVNGY